MALEMSPNIKSYWEVFLLFIVPVGGGIPAGVVLGKARGLHWLMMTFLYFLSDVALACLFDPVMHLFIYFGRKSPKIAQLNALLKQTVDKSTAQYGVKPGPFLLVLIAFGVDPMTGRAATRMAGHGFFTGWALAITGDMLFYLVIMVSTLWLNNILGDGTWTVIIIMFAMIVIPAVVRKIRERWAKKAVRL